MATPQLHEVDKPEEHFPPDIRTSEGRALYRAFRDLGDHVFEAVGGLTAAVARIESRLDTQKPASLPPARKEQPSYLDLVEQARIEALEALRKQADRTPGSTVDAEPEELADIVEGILARALEAREDAANRKTLQGQRRLIKAAAFAFVTSVAGAAGLWTWAHAQGHAEGYLEGRTHPASTSAPAR